MNWICPQCNEELGELNAYCVYCKVNSNTIVYNPNKYYIRDIKVSHISEGANPVTPQEELFAELFNKYARSEELQKMVKDMSILEIQAARGKFAKIAFEARAATYAYDEAEKEVKKKLSPGPKGFERSINIDEASSDAINTIKERQKKLSGKEKMLSNLIELYVKGGMSRLDAEKTATSAMGAGKILGQLKEKDEKSKAIVTGQTTHSPLSQENGFVIQKAPESLSTPQTENKPSEAKPMFNPFAKIK